MSYWYNAKIFIIARNRIEIDIAKKNSICRIILYEENNIIHKWQRYRSKWIYSKYVAYDDDIERDNTVTGLKAYQSFYKYCGKNEVERMKAVYRPIAIWESQEQMHFANVEHINKKIYKPVYKFDANSSFTYGAYQLPSDFDIMKSYFSELYLKKENAVNKIDRSRYKNMQNFLIGYFARINGFISVRSKIIHNSNVNIMTKIREISKNGGSVYLSNTDSIVTDSAGAEVMSKYLGTKAGQFKLEQKAERLVYKSSNAYQLDDHLVYSGVRYFARKDIDLFKDEHAIQKGSFIEPANFMVDVSDNGNKKLCSIRLGEIVVTKTNSLGEVTKITRYFLE